MHRRRLLTFATYGGLGLLAGSGAAALWLSGEKPVIAGFATITEARRWLALIPVQAGAAARSRTDWPLPQVLEHCAQSIEFSLHGFPEAKPVWFQHSAGALAFSVFDHRGRMRHGLTEPIPGAAALVETDLGAAISRLDRAFADFESHTGPLMPHFAYGALDKAQYTRAHLMHLANHAEEIALG